MKTIIAMASIIVIIGMKVAFGQSSNNETVTLSSLSRLEVGFGGIDDFVNGFCPDSAGDLFINGNLFSPPSLDEASAGKYSLSGERLWQTNFDTTYLTSSSYVNQMVYNPADNSVIAASGTSFNTVPTLIAKLDGRDGHEIWQVQREMNSYYVFQLWKDYIVAFRAGPNTTVFLLNDSDGSVASSFLVDSYGTLGNVSLQMRGDSMWIFANNFMAKVILPSGQPLWKIPTTDFSTTPVSTFGTIDAEGNAYVCTSDFSDTVNDKAIFSAAKYSSVGEKMWVNHWYGWADTSRASGLDLNNWVEGVAVDESSKIAVVFGGVQQAGTSGFDNNNQSAYLAFLNASNGDTMLTNKWNDDKLAGLPDPGGEGTNWRSGFFNQQNQLVMLGYGGIGDPNPSHIPADNFISTFNVGIITGVTKQPNQPTSFALDQNYPNPFNPVTMIRYSIPAKSFVTLTVYNILGQEVKTLVQGEMNSGVHEMNFDGSSLPSGIYFYRLSEGKNFAETKKMVLLK